MSASATLDSVLRIGHTQNCFCEATKLRETWASTKSFSWFLLRHNNLFMNSTVLLAQGKCSRGRPPTWCKVSSTRPLFKVLYLRHIVSHTSSDISIHFSAVMDPQHLRLLVHHSWWKQLWCFVPGMSESTEDTCCSSASDYACLRPTFNFRHSVLGTVTSTHVRLPLFLLCHGLARHWLRAFLTPPAQLVISQCSPPPTPPLSGGQFLIGPRVTGSVATINKQQEVPSISSPPAPLQRRPQHKPHAAPERKQASRTQLCATESQNPAWHSAYRERYVNCSAYVNAQSRHTLLNHRNDVKLQRRVFAASSLSARCHSVLVIHRIPFCERGLELAAPFFFSTFAPPSSSALCHGSQSSAISTCLLSPHPPPPPTNSSCHRERDFLQRLDVQESPGTTAGQLTLKKKVVRGGSNLVTLPKYPSLEFAQVVVLTLSFFTFHFSCAFQKISIL